MNLHHIPDLSARQLASVIAISEYNSFIAAAVAMRTSQPALSRTIKRVETVLGVRLFERSTRRVQITDAGREFLAVSRRMLNDLTITVRSMHELAEEQRGQIILSSIMSVASGLLPRMIALYRTARPGIEIQVREGVHGTVLEDVRSGVADLGITYIDELPNGVASAHLGREAFDLIVPAGHRLLRGKRGKGVTIADLAGVTLVSMPSDSQTRRIIDAAAASTGIALDHGVVVNQIATMMSFIRAGAGIGIAPSRSLASLLGDTLVRIPLARPRLVRTLGFITLKDRAMSPAAAGLAQTIRGSWPKRD